MRCFDRLLAPSAEPAIVVRGKSSVVRYMQQMIAQDPAHDLAAAEREARYLAELPETESPRVFFQLCQTRRLSHTVHKLNLLSHDPDRRTLANRALHALGF